MATPNNLIGLGVPAVQAGRLGMAIVSVTCAGATAGAAKQLGGFPGIYVVNASNSGSGVALPQMGGQTGALLSDEFIIANIVGGTIYVYANATGLGSAVTFYGDGVSTAGTTGISVATGFNAMFRPITMSTWIYTKVSA